MRILVKEVNWLGDLVLSLPALHALRRVHPTAEVSVLVRPDLAPFFDGFVDASPAFSVILYDVSAGMRGLRDRWQLASVVRAHRFDLAVIFPKSVDAALVPFLAGVPRRVGWKTQGRGLLLTDKPPFPDEKGHQVHLYLRLLRETLGIEGSPDDAAIPVAPRHRAAMRAWLANHRRDEERPLIALAVGAAYGPAKEWPGELYSALIDRLAADGVECILIGAGSERGKCERVAAASRASAIIAAGQMHLGETIALLSLCQGFAGNDSGAMHLAGALGLPTVGIFGSTDPELTAPLGPRVRTIYHHIECSPCFARTCRYGHYDCLRGIAVEEVAQALGAEAPDLE